MNDSRYGPRMRWILVVVATIIVVIVSLVFLNRDPDLEVAVVRPGERAAGNDSPPIGPQRHEAVRDRQLGGAAEEPVDPDPEGMADLARIMLGSSLNEVLPNYQFSSDQIERIAASTLKLRRAQSELEKLPEDPGFEERRRALSDEIEAAANEIAEVMDMNPDQQTQGDSSSGSQEPEPSL